MGPPVEGMVASPALSYPRFLRMVSPSSKNSLFCLNEMKNECIVSFCENLMNNTAYVPGIERVSLVHHTYNPTTVGLFILLMGSSRRQTRQRSKLQFLPILSLRRRRQCHLSSEVSTSRGWDRDASGHASGSGTPKELHGLSQRIFGWNTQMPTK